MCALERISRRQVEHALRPKPAAVSKARRGACLGNVGAVFSISRHFIFRTCGLGAATRAPLGLELAQSSRDSAAKETLDATRVDRYRKRQALRPPRREGSVQRVRRCWPQPRPGSEAA